MPNKIHAKQELYYKILQSNGSPHLVKVTKNFFVAGLCILSPFLILQAYNKMSFLFFTLSENLKFCPKKINLRLHFEWTKVHQKWSIRGI